jgi:hypothetical protein
MPAEATCPHCHLTLRVPSDYGGKSVKCPQCQQRFTVAFAGPPAPAPSKLVPVLPRAGASKSSGSFENLVLSALEEEDEAEAAPAQTLIKPVAGPSHFWRCPKCQALWEKKVLSTAALQNSRIKAMVRCETCGSAYDYQAVHDGRYDAPEVSLACTKCHLELSGPAEDLLGKPCPACGERLPEPAGR